MQIKRDAHKSKYTCISNGIFTDNRLSLAARALMGAVLSLPDSWEFSVSGIAAVLGINKTSAKKYLNELEAYGYLKTSFGKENGRYTAKQFYFIEVPADENSVDENSVDENSVDENSVDENSVDENSVDENSVDENSVDENSVDENSVDENSVDENSVDENSVDENSVDENTVTVISPQLNNNIPITKKPNTNSINRGERRASIASHEVEMLSAEFGAELADSALDTLNDYLNAKNRTINGVVVDNAELVYILGNAGIEDIREALKAVQAKSPASFAGYFGTVLFNLVKRRLAKPPESSNAEPYSPAASPLPSINFDKIMQEIYGKYRG